MGSPPKTERNLDIVDLRKAGLTYAAIGSRFDLTRERVWQILLKEAMRGGMVASRAPDR